MATHERLLAIIFFCENISLNMESLIFIIIIIRFSSKMMFSRALKW